MPGSVLVVFDESRDVFVDNQLLGVTGEPFDVELGTHDFDLGEPADYKPLSRHLRVMTRHTPLKPLVVKFTRNTP